MLLSMHGYDAWKTATPTEYEHGEAPISSYGEEDFLAEEIAAAERAGDTDRLAQLEGRLIALTGRKAA